MKNNVYVAGSLKNRVAIKKLMNSIENWGYKITADWTNYKDGDSAKYGAEESVQGLKECDCLIYCMDGVKSRGKYFELGYVSALGKPITIYFLPNNYYITDLNCDTLPFNVIIENESVFIRSGMYPVMYTIDELKTWLSNIKQVVER